MNPERWQQIKNLFNRTIDLDAAARHAFLQQHAGDDPTLIAEVEQLLEQNEAAGDFLEKPVTDRISKVAIFTGGVFILGTFHIRERRNHRTFPVIIRRATHRGEGVIITLI